MIPINVERSDNGWIECQTCAFSGTQTCDFCDEADQYEEGEGEEFLQHRVELLAA